MKTDTKNIAFPIETHSLAKQRAAADKTSLSDYANKTLLADLLKRKATAVKHPAAKGRKGLRAQ